MCEHRSARISTMLPACLSTVAVSARAKHVDFDLKVYQVSVEPITDDILYAVGHTTQ